MGIGIAQYRATIGLFNACSLSSSACHGFSNLDLFTIILCLLCKIIICILLISSGDVHPNPGPSVNCYNKLSICHINIRSLRATASGILKLDLIRNEIANVYDIITISETWLANTDNVDFYNIKNFHPPFFLNRNQNGGGVLCWVKETLVAKRLQNFEIDGLEALWLEIKSKSNRFYLCNVYRPPSSPVSFWEKLQNSLDNIENKLLSPLIITGDLNADPSTSSGSKLSNFCQFNGLSILIHEPTRITQNSQTILDQFLTNMPGIINQVKVEPPLGLNDHCTVSCYLNFNVKPIPVYSRLMWDFKNANFDGYRRVLNSIDWEELINNDRNIDDMCNDLTSTIYNTCKQFIPNKMVKVRPSSKAFYNNYLRRLKRKLNKTHNKAKQNNTSASWAKFRLDRNFYNREVTRVKEEFEQNNITKLNSNDITHKTYFKMAKEIFGKTNDTNIPSLINDASKIITDDLEKANVLNNFFVKASNIDSSDAILPELNDPIPGITLLNNIVITEQEVGDQIKLLDPSKSFGPDEISPVFIKSSGESLIKPLTRLYNISLASSKFPNMWKVANVLPLYKKGEKTSPNNYRPVSLLCILSKIFEKIVFKHLYNHFRDNFLISVWQSGFLPGSSTVTQLVELHYQFCHAISQNKEVRIVFLDITKAFDRVWHNGLLFKLKKWGICGNVLEWLKSYLTDRYQRVLLNGKKSNYARTNAGVPQGSVLGPLLFLVFINDLTHVVKHCKIRLFADDTCLFITVDNKETAANQINEDLLAIENWANKWLVSFSAPKTESMIFTSKTKPLPHPPLYLNNLQISNVKEHKHVGLWFEQNLWWHYHINDICNKANKRLNVLNCFKYKLSRNVLENMYMVFIRPIMEYADIVWAGAHDSDLVKLDRLQVQAMRLVTGCTKRSNILNLYKECSWNTLDKRREVHILTLIYKIVNRQAPLYLLDILPKKVSEITPYPVRNADNFDIPKTKHECFRKSCIIVGCKLWNNLDTNIRNVESCLLFKKSLKSNILKVDNVSFTKQLYNSGSRRTGVWHSRLRVGCSLLNFDLCNNLRVIGRPSCNCGFKFENSKHYFLQCPLYTNERRQLLDTIQDLTTTNININLLLFGNVNLSLNLNKNIFEAVHLFMIKTRRFFD